MIDVTFTHLGGDCAIWCCMQNALLDDCNYGLSLLARLWLLAHGPTPIKINDHCIVQKSVPPRMNSSPDIPSELSLSTWVLMLLMSFPTISSSPASSTREVQKWLAPIDLAYLSPMDFATCTHNQTSKTLPLGLSECRQCEIPIPSDCPNRFSFRLSSTELKKYLFLSQWPSREWETYRCTSLEF